MSTFSSDFFAEAVRPILFIFDIYIKGKRMLVWLLLFFSSRLRTLVVMAIYSFHRLIMGKVEIGIFPVSIWIYGFCLQKR